MAFEVTMVSHGSRITRAKTAKGKKFLAAKEPKVNEGLKTCLLLKMNKCNEIVSSIFKDFLKLRSRQTVVQKFNGKKPFECHNSLDDIMKKHDASLFIFGSSSKKNPSNLIVGRYFDSALLDMLEIKVLEHTSMEILGCQKKNEEGVYLLNALPAYSIPILSFDNFPTEEKDFCKIRNLLTDVFCAGSTSSICVNEISFVIHFTCLSADEKLFSMNVYKINKDAEGVTSGLCEIGPYIRFKVTLTHFADDDLVSSSLQKKKEKSNSSKKNMERSEDGGTLGRIHMKTQDFTLMPQNKFKGISRKSKLAKKGNAPSEAPAL